MGLIYSASTNREAVYKASATVPIDPGETNWGMLDRKRCVPSRYETISPPSTTSSL